jgi:hypothetical protein
LTGQQDFLAGIGAPAQASGQVDLSGLNFGNASSGSSLSDLFGGNTFGGFLGKTENGVATQGWGGLALGAAQSIGNIFMGMKQYGLAKDQLTQSKKQFDLNFGAQQKLTNANLEDRQRARVASNPGAYQSVGDYMKAHGI